MLTSHVIRVALFVVLCSAAVSRAKPLEVGSLRFGGELRLRAEGFENILDLDDEEHDAYSFYRFRTRLWTEAHPREGLRIYFRLGNEYRWGRGENTAGVRDPDGKISLDNAYAEVSSRGLMFSFGRMDLMYGEGFLVFDGTPADGSGSQWFDAMKLSWMSRGTTLDFLYAKLDDEGFGGPSADEDLFGIYINRRALDLYILTRSKNEQTPSASGAIRPARTTTASGFRLARLPRFGLHFALEGTWQFGTVDVADTANIAFGDEVESSAFGAYCRGGWSSSARFHPGLAAGGLYLSGDDRETEEYEGWDGFYSEWPKYSELFVYTLYDNTTRIAYNEPGTWTNIMAGWFEASVQSDRWRLAARFTSFYAPETFHAGQGDERGKLFAVRGDCVVAEGVRAQAVGELFDPGDFYGENVDASWYARWQITASF